MKDHPILSDLRKLAAKFPLPEGEVPNDFADGGALLFLDRNGRVYQVLDAHVTGGSFRTIKNARSELMELMDKLGVVDIPDRIWDAAKSKTDFDDDGNIL